MKRNKIFLRSFFIAAVILLAGFFYYLPYYVTKPGMAKQLEPIIEVEGGYDESGDFMLTTVRMGRANIYSYLTAKVSKFQEIYPVEEIRREDETDEEYNVRQLHLMDTSKTAAIEVAYKKAGLPVDYEYRGVYVMNVLPDMPADGVLKAGDMITQVDNQKFESSEEFISYVSGKKEGDTITLAYKRGEESNEAKVSLKAFKDDPDKVGIGISLVDDKEIKVDPEVSLNTEEIGGPSAGLMFSLEIYNQLTKDDLTRGYQIAGTGTISADGTVGRIGGIEQKIVAADKAGAEIFLAPNENGAAGSNYSEAAKTAEEIGTDMKIIPINTFEEAADYLAGLEPK
ncbi:SepM family pheromone-processing serine protease [Bacillus infantis]|uniref:SepM family pheromone-processing serine protease n=1 Tax=Bacillus infantis TaxID=324767 RepID=UPI003CEE97F6